MSKSEAIKVSVSGERERKRRRRELLLAAGLFVFVVLLSVIELRFLGENFTLFMVLFNVNFILMLIILLLVARNGVKLLLERRRKVLGSRLRSRLVLAFISLSLVPTVLMFLLSIQFVQTSVDFWFKSQVENSMNQALEVGEAFFENSRARLERHAKSVATQIKESGVHWDGPGGKALIDRKYEEYDLIMLGVISPDLASRHWSWTERFAVAWPEMLAAVDWTGLRTNPVFWSMKWPGAGDDFVIGVYPLSQAIDGTDGYIVLGERVGSDLLVKLDQIVKGAEEYEVLKQFRQPLKVTLYFSMGMLTLLIVFGAMWFGFRLAKELTEPIQALAEGTQRIARGDLSVRLDDTSSDELGVLVRSFNSMAQDLDFSQGRLTEANEQLNLQYAELEQRGRYIEAVLDNIAAGVVSLDTQGAISTMNKAAAAMFGVDGKAFLGQAPQVIVPDPKYAQLVDEAQAYLQKNPGSQWQRQLDVPIGNQELRLFVNIVALTTSEGNDAGIVAVCEDITELEKMQRMAAWREVARRIAHEIKNPLTPIKLSAQRLERKFAKRVDDQAFGECTGLIVRQVEYLQRMVSEFSEFAKLPEVVLKPGELGPMLEEVVALFQHSHSNIHWDIALSDLPTIKFDHEGLRRGVINILTNAVEALEGQADATVRVSSKYYSRLHLVRLEFQDNGPGLTKEERSRIFEPYFSRKKGGTGLGLTILKSIISDHHGYVRFQAAPDKGSILVVELPST